MRVGPAHVALVLLAAAVLGQSRPAPETDFPGLVKALGSDDFAAREAAQKRLDALGYKARDQLIKLAAEQTDPEVKARLQAGIAQIDEEIALDPPPISLKIENATLGDLVAALRRSLGMEIQTTNRGDTGRWTLSVEDRPFWEVFAELSRQHGIQLDRSELPKGPGMPDAKGPVLSPMGGAQEGWNSLVTVGGVAFIPQSVDRYAHSDLQRPKGAAVDPETMSLNFIVAFDPRFKLARVGPAIVSEVLDDAGNVLYRRVEADGPPALYDVSDPFTTVGASIPLTILARPGKMIASAKGSISYAVLLAQRSIIWKNAEKKEGESVTLAGTTLRLSKIDLLPDHFDLKFAVDDAPSVTPQPAHERTKVTVKVTDAKGKVFWNLPLRANSNLMNSRDYTLPLTMEFTAPTRTRQVTVPFEFKDLPLPSMSK